MPSRDAAPVPDAYFDVIVAPDGLMADAPLDAPLDPDTGDSGPAPDAAVGTDSGSPPDTASPVVTPLDLRPYFASAGTTQRYRTADGRLYATYVFQPATSDFDLLYTSLMDQGTPGHLITWQKIYDSPHAGCTATYAQLWMGDNRSVTEVGDWFATDGCTPSIAFGYHTLDRSRPSGLTWSPTGGVNYTTSAPVEVSVFHQATPGAAYAPGGAEAYSDVVLLEHFDAWTAPVGRSAAGAWVAGEGRTYADVVRVLFYHGVRDAEIIAGARAPTRCTTASYDPSSPNGRLYHSYSNYESYTIELYLARGHGIVREALGFTESSYWGAANVCRGAFMGYDAAAAQTAWAAHLDE
ncbi:MAG: hypothetical protein WCJ30_20625 [Deltaproteobacteria bacterium]